MKRPIFLVLILAALIATPLLLRRSNTDSPQGSAQLLIEPPNLSGFARAEGPMPLQFPADYGAHPDYQTEWWYYTGNLDTPDGQHFGYQLTIFRRALLPPDLRTERQSGWAADQVYLGHLALTDATNGDYYAFERFSRGAANLAGAQASPYHIWLEDWQIEETAPRTYRLRATQDQITIDLLLVDEKGPALQGIDGYSQKGPEPGNASYYYSLTRLTSSGTIQIGPDNYTVTGLSWMDHEYSTSALGAGQVGWDWFSIQLDDQSELMLFQLRRDDGSLDPYSEGLYIAPDGSTTSLTIADFTITAHDTWRSPHSGATYPAQWTIDIPSLDLTLELQPWLADQELNLAYTYWEGAVQIEGQRAGQVVSGNGYVELTGYLTSMQGTF